MKRRILKSIILLFILVCHVQTTHSQTLITDKYNDMEFFFNLSDFQNNRQLTWMVDLGRNKFVQLNYAVEANSADSFYAYNVDDNWNIVSTLVRAASDHGGESGMVFSNIPNGKILLVYNKYGDYDDLYGFIDLYFYVLSHQNRGISYAYDASGNRVSKTIVLSINNTFRSARMTDDQPMEKIVYEERLDYTKGIEKKEADIFIYPNPTQGRFSVEIKNQQGDEISGEVSLIRANGQLIDKKNAGQKLEFDLTGESSGVYFVNIQLGEKVSTWKVIKK